MTLEQRYWYKYIYIQNYEYIINLWENPQEVNIS